MSEFIKKFIIYSLSFIMISILFFYAYKPKWRVGEEVQMVMDLIEKVNPNQIDTIRIGDSVGKNIIGTGLDSNCLNLGSNQAISMLGQYLLLNKFIVKRDIGYKNLYIEAYVRPSSFYNNLDQEWTFNYFIKFFYNRDWFFNKSLLTNKIQNKIDSDFLNSYTLRNLIKYSYFVGFSIFTYPKFGNNEKVHRPNYNLIDLFILQQFDLFKLNVKFKSMPISRKNYQIELKLFENIKRNGFDIHSPFLLNDSVFSDDSIHLKPKFRGINFYRSNSINR